MSDAGYGAEQQASRMARKAARLRDEAAHGAAVDAEVLRRTQAAQRNWSAGAEGERLVAASLAHLERYGWVTLHDLRWPGRQRANIDHIAVGPGGIVVVDAKNWSGSVTVADGALRQNGYRRDSSAEGAAQAAADVTAMLAPQHRTAVRAALCLAAQDQQPTPVQGVDVVGRWDLPRYLLGLPHRLSPYDVADVARYLATELGTPAARAPRRRPSTRPHRAVTPARGRTSRRTMSKGRAALIQLMLTLVGIFFVYQFVVARLQEYASSIGG